MTGSDPPGLFQHDVAQARLVAQHLVGPGAPTVTEAVRWLTAMQAQDYASALTSAGLRTRTPRRAKVITALDAGDIVRPWPMRGTLHLTTAEDLAWMLRLLAPRAVWSYRRDALRRLRHACRGGHPRAVRRAALNLASASSHNPNVLRETPSARGLNVEGPL